MPWWKEEFMDGGFVWFSIANEIESAARILRLSNFSRPMDRSRIK
jgi:hypothetical protein